MTRKFKPFTASDIFKGIAIIGKLDLQRVADCFKAPAVKAAIKDGEIEGDVGVAVGFELLDLLIENLTAIKDDLLELIASKVADKKMTAADLEAMPADEFLDLVMDLFTSPEAADFGEAVLRQRARIQRILSKDSTAGTQTR